MHTRTHSFVEKLSVQIKPAAAAKAAFVRNLMVLCAETKNSSAAVQFEVPGAHTQKTRLPLLRSKQARLPDGGRSFFYFHLCSSPSPCHCRGSLGKGNGTNSRNLCFLRQAVWQIYAFREIPFKHVPVCTLLSTFYDLEVQVHLKTYKSLLRKKRSFKSHKRLIIIKLNWNICSVRSSFESFFTLVTFLLHSPLLPHTHWCHLPFCSPHNVNDSLWTAFIPQVIQLLFLPSLFFALYYPASARLGSSSFPAPLYAFVVIDVVFRTKWIFVCMCRSSATLSVALFSFFFGVHLQVTPTRKRWNVA